MRKYCRYNVAGRQFLPEVEIEKCLISIYSISIVIQFCCILNVETDLMLRETGVAEIELTSVITVDIKHVVSTFWGDKEASASGAKIM